MPSAWNWFTGADKANKQAMDTANKNNAYITGGRDRELGYYRDARDAGRGYLSPYEQAGRRGMGAYENLLGLNGSGAQAGAREAYNGWNPYLGDDMTAATKAIDRRAAATGSFGSGMNALAGARARTEMGSRDFYNYNDRLQGLGQMGYGAANALAGNEWQYANGAGNAERAATQGYVSNNTNLGNALSASQISPMNFMMQNAKMAISALGGGKGGGYGGAQQGGNAYPSPQSNSGNNFWGYL